MCIVIDRDQKSMTFGNLKIGLPKTGYMILSKE